MSAELLVEELHLRGIKVRPDGDALVLQPGDQLTPELSARLIAGKTDLLVLLRRAQNYSDNTDTDNNPTAALSPPISSPESLSEADDAAPLPPTYTAEELAQLAQATPAMRATIDELNGIFADTGGVTVLSVATARQRVAGLIREARRASKPGLAVALRDCWRERVAICTVDGAVPESEARSIALAEVEAMQ